MKERPESGGQAHSLSRRDSGTAGCAEQVTSLPAALDRAEKHPSPVHPCFDSTGCGVSVNGRMHLSVAPRCNIRCNYCRPSMDCPNESRPGVTSKVLLPTQALVRVQEAIRRFPFIKVIGIAGPGDPLCNAQTFETLALVKQSYPDLALCISTNGLALIENLDELRDLGVRFLTVTVNALDAAVGAKIYNWVVWERKKRDGRAGAELLIERQWRAMAEAVRAGFYVKVNTVMIPTVNTRQIPDIARRAQQVGAQVHNITPLIPVPGTPFADLPSPAAADRRQMQLRCAQFVPQLLHCRQCRADAVGLLDSDSGLDPADDERVRTQHEARASPVVHDTEELRFVQQCKSAAAAGFGGRGNARAIG